MTYKVNDVVEVHQPHIIEATILSCETSTEDPMFFLITKNNFYFSVRKNKIMKLISRKLTEEEINTQLELINDFKRRKQFDKVEEVKAFLKNSLTNNK